MVDFPPAVGAVGARSRSCVSECERRARIGVRGLRDRRECRLVGTWFRRWM